MAIWISKMWKPVNIKWWWGCGIGTLTDCWWELKLMKMQNSTATFGTSLAVSYKGKHIPTTWPSNLTPRNGSKRKENMFAWKSVSKYS